MRRFYFIFCFCFGMVLVLLSGCEKIQTPMFPDTHPAERELTVMTYNVYVGSSAVELLSVENIIEVPSEVAKMYNNVIASDFPGRAAAIAASIKVYQPHIIGLQEMSLIRRQSPGNSITERTPDAEEVVIDFLKVLLDALKAEGLVYSVAAKVENIDAEMPMFTDTGIVDVRLTDSDVILVRSDVAVSRPMSGNYTNTLSIEKLGLQVKRGYVAVDATVAGRTYRIVNTHLEAYTEEAVRVAQMQELVDHLSDETLPILVLGDFNTPAPDGTAYQLLLSAGYVDLWQMDAQRTGNTCCQDGDLLNEMSLHSQRIDQIFARNLQPPASILTQTLGDTPKDRLPSGFWPSDHAGVVAQLVSE